MPRQINALIVDDLFTMRKLIMTLLKKTGLAEFVFTEAEDGIDALAKYRPGVTQILFVDMHMPRMGGLEFVRELHSKHETCPSAVIITAESREDKLAEALAETGVDAVLLKPVDRHRLRAGLKTLIDSIPEHSGSGALAVVPHGECVPRALQEVLAEACDLELTPGSENEGVRSGDIVLAMISALGEVRWSVVMGFARNTAEAVASRFMGTNALAGERELGNAISGIANMVSRRIKGALAARDTSVSLSLPTVVSASTLRILVQPGQRATDYVYFDSPVGKLWTLVSVGTHTGLIL